MKGGFGCSPCCGTPCQIFGTQTEFFYPDFGVAQSFTTPAGGLTLHTATLFLYGFGPTPTASDFLLDLYSDNNAANDNNSHPDTLLLTLTTASTFVNTGGYRTLSFTAPDEPLTGSTRYWLFATMKPDYSLPGEWWYTIYDPETCPSVPRALGFPGNWIEIDPFVQQLLTIN